MSSTCDDRRAGVGDRRLSRRAALGRVAGAGATAALAAVSLSRPSASTAQEGTPMTDSTPTATAAPTVVLVHGAFADASGWAGVHHPAASRRDPGDGAGQSAARRVGRRRLHRQRGQPDSRPGAAGRPLLRRRGDQQRRADGRQRGRPGLRRRLHPGRGGGVADARRAGEGQPARSGPAAGAVPDRRRERAGRRVLHRSGLVPRGLLRRLAGRAGGGDGRLAAPRRRRSASASRPARSAGRRSPPGRWSPPATSRSGQAASA